MSVKKIFAWALVALMSLGVACEEPEREWDDNSNSQGNTNTPTPDPEPDEPDEPEYVPTEEDKKVNLEIFELINLDYPGLVAVKREYNQKHYANAAQQLVTYMRNRLVVNTLNPLDDKTLYPASEFIANQALELRFCVKVSTWMDGANYYSFDDGQGGINWNFEAPGAGSEFYQKHWHAWFYYLGQVLFATGDDKYFDAWKSQYSDWLEHYPIPTQKVDLYAAENKAWYPLSLANRITSQLKNLPFFLTSDHFTGDWLATVLVELHKTVEFSRANPYYTQKSNIRLAQDAALVHAAVLMPEFKKSAEWLAEGANNLSQQLQLQFHSDGAPIENSISYGTGVIDNLRSAYEVAKANNSLSSFPTDYVATLKNACHFIADYIYPNYTWECFNDTFQTSQSVLTRNIGYYAEMFPEEGEFLYISTAGAQGTKPSKKLISYPVGGFYFLRNGWDNNSTVMIYTNNYNPTNYTHSHNDNGTFSLWSRGRNFMPDAGVYTYGGNSSLDAIRDRNKATASHNTLTKNLADIAKGYSLGKHLLTQSQENGVQVVVAENKSYSDLTHRRAVFMVDDSFYVIVDEAYGTAANVPINVSFHLCRDTSKGVDVVTIDDHSSNYAYGAHTTFTNNINMKWLTFSEGKSGFKGENGISYYSEKLMTEQSRKYYRVTATKPSVTDAARFITVIHPDTGATIAAEFATAYSATGASVKVSINGKSYNLSYKL